jgi:hypothetical protein
MCRVPIMDRSHVFHAIAQRPQLIVQLAGRHPWLFAAPTPGAGPGRLTAIDLSGAGIADAQAVCLAAVPVLNRLVLARNAVGDHGALALARASHLRQLDLRQNRVGPLGACALADSASLDWLDLRQNPVGAVGWAQLVLTTTIARLEFDAVPAEPEPEPEPGDE